ncbi:hypothetical protein CROQUDRAFT_44117, partial [Cronartium quercuum f. sp. fusiforme G11]
LIEIMTNWNLLLHSPKGIPTFGLNRTNSEGTSIDQVWVNEEADNMITACLIDSNNKFNHNSDHQALITILSPPPNTASKNYSDKAV